MKKIFLIFIFALNLFCEREIYIAERVKGKIEIDGDIREEEWGKYLP